MDKDLRDWVSEQVLQGSEPLDITAGVAREITKSKGLPINGDQPSLLDLGSLEAPKGVKYTTDLIGSVYEQSLDSLTRRHGGVHYTPFEIARKLARIALEGLPVGPVCDPSVGGGSFLLAAAEYLNELGESPTKIVQELLWGIDLDQGAIKVANASISIWGSSEEWVTPNNGHLTIANSLQSGLSSFSEPPKSGFVAVIGNPPFQNQLQESTVRPIEQTRELREKWQVDTGPYADTASYFLLMALSLLGEMGKCLLIQPQSILSTVDAEPIRLKLTEVATLEGIWIGGANIFEAGVNVCAPLISKGFAQKPVRIWKGAEITELKQRLTNQENWANAMAIAQDVPRVHLSGDKLGERSAATAGFRDQFYGLAPHVYEDEISQTTVAPLITVGMIDPLRNRWGAANFRYAGKSWSKPVVNLETLNQADQELYEWVKERLRPKVLLATQTKVLEVVPDLDGKLIPSTPVISIECDPQDIWKITAVLSSAAMSAYAFSTTAGSALSSNTIKLSAKQVMNLPLPSESNHWTKASKYAESAFNAKNREEKKKQMLKMSEEINIAYGCDNEILQKWWIHRLPKWR